MSDGRRAFVVALADCGSIHIAPSGLCSKTIKIYRDMCTNDHIRKASHFWAALPTLIVAKLPSEILYAVAIILECFMLPARYGADADWKSTDMQGF